MLIHEAADGQVEIQCAGHCLAYAVFDKQPLVAPGEVIENKRPGAVLSLIHAGQEERDARRLDLGLEFLLVHRKDLGGDDGTRAATEPTRGGGARDTEGAKEAGVTFFADEVAKAMVISTTTGRGWHASRLIARVREASQHRCNSFSNFAAVAVATPKLQNVLVRSWAAS